MCTHIRRSLLVLVAIVMASSEDERLDTEAFKGGPTETESGTYLRLVWCNVALESESKGDQKDSQKCS